MSRGRGNGRGNPGQGRGYTSSNAPPSYNTNKGRGAIWRTRRTRTTWWQLPQQQPASVSDLQQDGSYRHGRWYRFTEDYLPEEKVGASATTNSYGIDTNWYADRGATNHITGELEKLTICDKYYGGDQVHTADGAGHGEGAASRQM